jgi:hypothetical protein
MERMVLFQKNWNKIKAEGIAIANVGTKWNVYFHFNKKLEQNQSLRNF